LQAQQDAQAQALAQQAVAQQEQVRQFQQQQQAQLQQFQQQMQAQQQPQAPPQPPPQLSPYPLQPQPQLPYAALGGQPVRPTSAPPGFSNPAQGAFAHMAQGVLQPVPMPPGARGTKRSSDDLFSTPLGGFDVDSSPVPSAFGRPLPNFVQEAREASIRDAYKLSEGGPKHVGESGMPLDPLNPASLLSDTSHLSMLARLQKLERSSGLENEPVTIEGYFSESKRAVLNSDHLNFEQKTRLSQLYEQRQADMERSVRKFKFTPEDERWFVEELFMEQSLLSSDPEMQAAGDIVRRLFTDRRKERNKLARVQRLGERPASAPPSSRSSGPPPPPPRGGGKPPYVPVDQRVCYMCGQVGHEVRNCPTLLAKVSGTKTDDR
jgi:hypothetical protein